MNQNKTRQQLIDMYIQSLQEEQIPWRAGWNMERNYNPITKTVYRGINQMILAYVAWKNGYEDPRWCSFYNIVDEKGEYHPNQKWHLKKGSKGVPVELWKVKNIKTGKYIDFAEYYKIREEDEEKAKDYRLQVHNYTVFNFSCIEGCPEYKKAENKEVRQETIQKFCDNAMTSMGITVQYEGDSAFYRPSTDSITLPKPESFFTNYDFYSTWLHEAGHATGHSERLNRNLHGGFGTEEYAKEELRVEIGSSFLMQNFQMEPSKKNLDNHKAYIQSWISMLKEHPEELFKAIADAKGIEEYLLKQGDFEKVMAEQAEQELQELQAATERLLDQLDEGDKIEKKAANSDEKKGSNLEERRDAAMWMIWDVIDEKGASMTEDASLYCLRTTDEIKERLLQQTKDIENMTKDDCWNAITEQLNHGGYTCSQGIYTFEQSMNNDFGKEMTR